jgi:hypothetical protein
MLLSEAMKLGGMLGDQLVGIFVDGEGGSCALGSVMLAIGYPVSPYTCGESVWRQVAEIYPTLESLVAVEEKWYHPMLWDYIVKLNNVEGWTREQIADWLVTSGNDCEAILPLAQVETKQEEPVYVAKR